MAGSSVGSLTLTDNAPNSPQIILLTGTGSAQPLVTVTPTSLNFGSQAEFGTLSDSKDNESLEFGSLLWSQKINHNLDQS